MSPGPRGRVGGGGWDRGRVTGARERRGPGDTQPEELVDTGTPPPSHGVEVTGEVRPPLTGGPTPAVHPSPPSTRLGVPRHGGGQDGHLSTRVTERPVRVPVARLCRPGPRRRLVPLVRRRRPRPLARVGARRWGTRGWGVVEVEDDTDVVATWNCHTDRYPVSTPVTSSVLPVTHLLTSVGLVVSNDVFISDEPRTLYNSVETWNARLGHCHCQKGKTEV